MLFLYNFSQLFELFLYTGYFFENKSLNSQSDIIFKKRNLQYEKVYNILYIVGCNGNHCNR